MIAIVLILLFIACALAAWFLLAQKRSPGRAERENTLFYDAEGNHVYYDRRLIDRKRAQGGKE